MPLGSASTSVTQKSFVRADRFASATSRLLKDSKVDWERSSKSLKTLCFSSGSKVLPFVRLSKLLNFRRFANESTRSSQRLDGVSEKLKSDPRTSGVKGIISKVRILERENSCVPRKVSVLFSFLGSNDNPIRMNVDETLIRQNDCVGLRNEG